MQLPEDRDLLAAMVRTLLWERNHEKQRAEELEQRAEEQGLRARAQERRAEEQAQRTEEFRVELLRLQLELERFKKCYYGPRADRLQSTDELSQLLLNFAEQLEQKPIHPGRCSTPGGTGAAAATRQAAQRAAPSCQLRKPSRHHARLRAERRRAGLPLLR